MEISVQHQLLGLSAQAIFTTIVQARDLSLSPPSPSLPELIKDFALSRSSLTQAKALVMQHLEAGHDLLVFGDYDADGITASAVMWLTLTYLAKGTKARVLPFIPDRARHSYGLTDASLRDLLDKTAFQATAYPDFAPALIITVDTGITAHRQVAKLREAGIDVIITDHHQKDRTLPTANVILHSLASSGSGLAWVVALALTDSSPIIYSFLDLAVIGIVTDQLPLVGLNRQLVIYGLQALSRSPRPGIRALAQVAGIENQSFSAYDLNFRLGPRLNAAGRLADATAALRLLCTADSRLATRLAGELDTHNRERQALTDEGVARALSSKPHHHLIITSSSAYHEGVIGLIAGKLVEAHSRPAVVICKGKEVSKGSARSLPGVDIIALLRRFSPHFTSLGGHTLAAGFSIKTVNIKTLQTKLESYADTHIKDSLLVPTYNVDGELTLSQTSLSLAHLLSRLAPFGLGNPAPCFVSRDLTVLEDRRLGEDGKHARLTIEADGITRQAIWFNLPADRQAVLPDLTSIKALVYSLDVNHYRGRDYLQLVVKHAVC